MPAGFYPSLKVYGRTPPRTLRSLSNPRFWGASYPGYWCT